MPELLKQLNEDPQMVENVEAAGLLLRLQAILPDIIGSRGTAWPLTHSPKNESLLEFQYLIRRIYELFCR